MCDGQCAANTRLLLKAGFGYSFLNPKLNKWAEPIGINELTSEEKDIFSQPLVHQPGEGWEYGINMDWTGRLIERVTGSSLNDYFQAHIFKPLGLSRLSFFPSAELKKHLASLHRRGSDGKMRVHEGGHIVHKPLVVSSPEEAKTVVNAGGHGLFCSPSEYSGMLARSC